MHAGQGAQQGRGRQQVGGVDKVPCDVGARPVLHPTNHTTARTMGWDGKRGLVIGSKEMLVVDKNRTF